MPCDDMEINLPLTAGRSKPHMSPNNRQHRGGRPFRMRPKAPESDISMGTFTYFAALVVMFLVAVVLVRGLVNMVRGGNPMTSNKLMQLRILLQAIAIALIMLTLWFTGGGRPQKTSALDVPVISSTTARQA
jgi:hypothetical protein